VAAPATSRWVIVPIALAAFITSLDNTVVNVALPSIQRDLDLSITGLQWIATSYILAFSGLLLAGGRLTDLVGRRTIFLVGMGVFVGASILAGFAPSGEVLIAARVLQGVGAALVLPATLAVLSADMAGSSRHLGAGVWTAAIALSLALGPVVGGAIAQYWNWHWIFLINLPFGLVTMAVGAATIGRVTRGALQAADGIDLPGVVTSAVAMVSLSYALIQGAEHGFGSPVILGSLAVAAVAALAFVLVERRAAAPMVDIRLFANRVVSGGTASQVLWGLGINGVFFFTSLFLQDSLGLAPTKSGLMFVPLAVLLVLFVPVAPLLVRFIGVHWTVSSGMAMIAAGLVWVSTVHRGESASGLLVGLSLIGIGSALTTPLTSSVLEVVPESRAGMASSVISVAREISGVFGIALVGAVVAVRESAALRAGANPLDAFADGYALGLWGAAALVLLGGVISLITLRPPLPIIPASLGTAPVPAPAVVAPATVAAAPAVAAAPDTATLAIRH
jgi:EmrB/QacA subfamily drug resistance transporter